TPNGTGSPYRSGSPHRSGIKHEIGVTAGAVVSGSRRHSTPSGDVAARERRGDIEISGANGENVVLVHISDAGRRISGGTLLWEIFGRGLHEPGFDLIGREAGILLQNDRRRRADHWRGHTR